VGYKTNNDTAAGFTVSVADLVTPPYAAEIVTLVAVATLVVVMLKCAEVAPAGIVTLAGTTADALELLNVTTAPAPTAGPVKYTVFVDGGTPPANTAGDKASDDTAIGFTVSVDVLVTPPNAAERVALVRVATMPVAMLNCAEVAPAGIVTLAGTTADALELVNVTVAPFAGAGSVRYTVPIAVAPEATEAGYIPTALTTTGFTVKVSEATDPDDVAVTITFTAVVTAVVAAVKVAPVAPGATATDDGTLA
jgi:hypothetical protein